MPSLRFLILTIIYLLQVMYALEKLYLMQFIIYFSSCCNAWIMASLDELNCIKKSFVSGRD